ncbi:thioredoxin-disulfide reductase [Candidatus Tisiphia endosymbiont of Nemotelus uliginosus]|uniref:thioredoxin-disulfide reductase n=1 Tax=Candidatus Tisiphia endosymbiont of Nemotelus uliginosus TaxID=3077926 RepID=UPI0035C8FA3E
MNFSTKLLIIGSGPAGFTAAIYAARAGLAPILINGMQPGGQLTITTDVENYPGFADTIQGPWLMEQMARQAEKVGTQIISDYIAKIDLLARPFIATTGSGKNYQADSVIICTGAEARWLDIPSEQQFKGYGVSACATCDGFFFKNQNVLVIGGGNSAVEEALYLTNHAAKVTVVHRGNNFRAEKILQDRLFKNPKISVIWDHKLIEVQGTLDPLSVTSAKLENTKNGQINIVDCTGIFIAIGHIPNTNLFKGQLDLDQDNYIITQPNSTETSIKGVFAAGDVQDKIFRQAVTAAGTGCMAALQAEKYLNQG